VRAVSISVAFLLGLSASIASAESFNITAAKLDRFALLTNATSFGTLTWRGGLELSSTNKKFGGLSGLIMTKDCASLLAVSDAGRWVKADVTYTGNAVSGLTSASIAPVLNEKGKPPKNKPWGDAEALATGPVGKTVVGFETHTRIGIYDLARKGLKAKFRSLNPPQQIANGPDNGELESVGYFATGTLTGNYIAIAESNFDAQGSTKAWIWNNNRSIAFSIKQLDDYEITDLAVLPDADVLILQRSYGLTTLPGMAISRFSVRDIGIDKFVEPETLLEAKVPFYAIDNMEGLAVCERGGELLVNLISDDNFNTELQRTLLLQFSYTP
jgi:hypothetical protein